MYSELKCEKTSKIFNEYQYPNVSIIDKQSETQNNSSFRIDKINCQNNRASNNHKKDYIV